MSKIWFVTGSSRGLGRSFVEAALERGDRVAATARNADSGRPPIQMVKDHYARKLATWAEWEHVSLAAHG